MNGRIREVAIERASGGFVVTIGDRTWVVDAARIDPRSLSLLMAEQHREAVASHELALVPDRLTGHLMAHLRSTSMPVALNGSRQPGKKEARQGSSAQLRIVAPMPGKVVRVLASTGASVKARQPVVVIEAMKMENELRTDRDGVVVEVPVAAGQSVEAGALLAVIGPAPGA